MASIISFSDLHGQYSKKLNEWFISNPADVLLFAGDLQLNKYDDGSKFLSWIDKLPYEHKICIFGNHDSNFLNVLQEIKQYKNIHFLNNESINIDGINIWGSPYSVQFMNWWFMKSEDELEKIYKNIPEDTNILLTHTPPFGILDKTVGGINIGSKSLLDRIQELSNLKYHLFGHCHENFGVAKINKTIFMNASMLDEKYSFVNMPISFEY